MLLSHFQLFLNYPVTKARKVASIHGILTGSRSNHNKLLNAAVNHSCLACTAYSSIFIPEKNSAQLHVDQVIKSRKKKVSNLESKNLQE